MLEGKTVVVSGTGPDLGREIAAAAVRDGANVVLGARTEANLEKAAQEIDPSGQRVAWQVTDITDAEQCRSLAQLAVDRYGHLDALVNVAALDTIFGGVEGADFSEWRRALEINVVGTMQATQAAVPYLKEQGGSIVFIGSQAMYWCQVPQAAYAASKAALMGAVAHLTRNLRAEEGCTVVLVEHDVGFVMRQCDRIVVLNLGAVIADGPPDQIRSDPVVGTAYLG